MGPPGLPDAREIAGHSRRLKESENGADACNQRTKKSQTSTFLLETLVTVVNHGRLGLRNIKITGLV